MSIENVDADGFLKTETPVTGDGTGTAPVAPEPQAAPDTAPQPRKRGRPRKNPEAPGTESIPDGSAPRPTKSKPGKKGFSASDIQMMGKQITGLHLLVAQMTGIPELSMQEAEGQMLAQSVVNVCEQYDLAIDGKTGAFIQLIGVAGMIYAPRYMHFRRRIAEQAQSAPGNVVAG